MTNERQIPRPRRARRAGLVGAAVGLTAAGVAIGLAAGRAIGRRPGEHDDPYATEEFGQAAYDEVVTVQTTDGVEIYAEVVDRLDGIELDADFAEKVAPRAESEGEPTLVFVHGFCLNMGVFHFQRKELTQRGDWRAVYYDQPGHGRSGRLAAGEYELVQLAEALKVLLDEVAPDEPVVLVGHSMGGMTIMAFAERYPELFAERVAGVVLIATSAGRLEATATAMPELLSRASRPLLPLVNGATRMTGGVIDRARRASKQLAWLLTQRYGFGAPSPSRALVSYVARMNDKTSTETVARYVRTLYTHSRYPTLEALRDKPVLLICGDLDEITPMGHSEEIKARLPEAELVLVPDSGHMVLLEHHEVVTEALLEFLEKLA
ncbi:alpha/beta hydrolase [Natronosporangium hydrolyticum]|uniref:Alpha/beta hydrolase n=1 Tax=Natronosporangium hydrolyticum TaxID=2811111 RepID=A0A895YJ65_9ACTN|nr:alpha/beta hydrolase [Natronosporangium hydrolyticum]QSB15569.1 alpha/beta hydrolase [Natronosporangium hydrolyticum]